MKQTITSLELFLAKTKKRFSLLSLQILEIRVIELNEEMFHKFVDATFSDFSVDIEEEQENLSEITEYLVNEILLDHCVAWTLSSNKLALLWDVIIDFDNSEIKIQTKENRMTVTKRPENYMTFSKETEIST